MSLIYIVTSPHIRGFYRAPHFTFTPIKKQKKRLLNCKKIFQLCQFEKLQLVIQNQRKPLFLMSLFIYYLIGYIYARKGLKCCPFYGLCSSFVSATPCPCTVLLHFVICIILTAFSHALFSESMSPSLRCVNPNTVDRISCPSI
jgi:hypothetical protein